MKTTREIILENIPKNCYSEDIDDITEIPLYYNLEAMEIYAKQRAINFMHFCNKNIDCYKANKMYNNYLENKITGLDLDKISASLKETLSKETKESLDIFFNR